MFLNSIKPIADDVGFPSAELLISTESGRVVLKSYLINAKQQLLYALVASREAKDNLDPNAPDYQESLMMINNTIANLEEQLNQLPEYEFLIQQWNIIKENENRLQASKQELDYGWVEYNIGLKDLNIAEKELMIAEKEIGNGRKELEKNRREVDKAKKN